MISILFFGVANASEKATDLDPALTTQVLIVEAQIFNRQFSEALFSCTHLFFEDRSFPLNLICRTLVLESAMFDREDFHREEEFKPLVKQVKSILTHQKQSPEIWQSLFSGAFWGIVGLHELRKHSYYSALKNGTMGLAETRRVSKLDPENQDVYLGLGIYDYYAAVLSHKWWWFPFALGDRDRGFAELSRAAYASVFAKDPAQLMLAFFYFREKKYEEAMSLAKVLIKKYPDNSMAGMLMARIFIAEGKTVEAIQQLKMVQKKNPAHRGVPLLLAELKLPQ
jgi:tetratricopeptide (TPR) repeat protein